MNVNRKKAFSLVELLVALVILISVSGAIYLAIYSSTRNTDQLELTVLLQEEARAVMDIIGRDLRLAGSFPNGIDDYTCVLSCNAILSATPSSIQISRDLDGDGCCDDYDEIVTYSFLEAQKELCRKASIDDQCQAFIGGFDDDEIGVGLESFEFVYYDRYGHITSDKDKIVRVQIRAVLVSNKTSISGRTPELPLELIVNIRNRVLGL